LSYRERQIVKTVAKAGEQWYFGIEEGGIERFLKKYGLGLRKHSGAHDRGNRYFMNASAEIVGRINDKLCLVRELKPGYQVPADLY
jgi:O-methyltransferase involved in polyketide biosynthesis